MVSVKETKHKRTITYNVNKEPRSEHDNFTHPWESIRRTDDRSKYDDNVIYTETNTTGYVGTYPVKNGQIGQFKGNQFWNMLPIKLVLILIKY